MNSLFKNVSNQLKKMSSCQIVLMVFGALVVGYSLYQYLKNTPTFMGMRMRMSMGNGNGNGNGVYMNVNRDQKEHFDNGGKTDDYYANSNDAVLVTFYAFSFCGHCKSFKPVWDEAESKDYPMKVKFRYIIADKLSPQEKSTIPYYVSAKYAPCVILTHKGQNIKEFDQQMSKPMKGLDEFVSTKGQVNSMTNSKHL